MDAGTELLAGDDGVREAIRLLAHFLYAEAGGESVRAREALAATISNQVDQLLGSSGDELRGPWRVEALRGLAFVHCLDRLGATAGVQSHDDDAVFASCRRIARRALSGALRDPTCGATRFHAIGISPAWSRSLNPRAWIGSFLFYSEEEAEGGQDDDGAEPRVTTDCESA
ncbi:MAG: cell wall hydrolase [Rhodospirillales bacterium]|nr:cell wall hydrolase [Rhodospirillales bacterium]